MRRRAENAVERAWHCSSSRAIRICRSRRRCSAAPELLNRGALLRRQIQARVTANYNHLAAAGAAIPACQVLDAEGGWYAIVRVPSLCPEEELVLNLLADADVLTHPGYFFDFAHESHLVVSLLVSETRFREGVSHMFGYLESSGGQA